MFPLWRCGFIGTSRGLPVSFNVQPVTLYVRQILSRPPGTFYKPAILCTILYFVSRLLYFHTGKMYRYMNRFHRAIYRARIRFGLFVTSRYRVAFRIKLRRRIGGIARLKMTKYGGGAAIGYIGFCYCFNGYSWFINGEWDNSTIRICYISSVLLETFFHGEAIWHQRIRRYRHVIQIYSLLTNPSLFLLIFPDTWNSMAPLFISMSYYGLFTSYTLMLESQNQEL